MSIWIWKRGFIGPPTPWGYIDSKGRKTCCSETYSDGRFSVCGNPGKFVREGRHYCGVHDPVKVAAKREATEARWKAEAEGRRRQCDRQDQEKRFREAAVAAIRSIAAGHNDARGLAAGTLAMEPTR